MPLLLWAGLVLDLRKRGQGRQESGAFLLGQQTGNSAKVRKYICYDEIDANAYQHGAIAFHADGYATLWKRCKELKLDVLADIHTHPGRDVRQSHIDQRHPMLPVVGHTALIMPLFAHTRMWSLIGVGVYGYLGNFKWRTHDLRWVPPRFKLTWW
jgi:proteasome lid subunit RPN8/RPN11